MITFLIVGTKKKIDVAMNRRYITCQRELVSRAENLSVQSSSIDRRIPYNQLTSGALKKTKRKKNLQGLCTYANDTLMIVWRSMYKNSGRQRYVEGEQSVVRTMTMF